MDTFEEVVEYEEPTNIVSLDRERLLRLQLDESEVVAYVAEQTCDGGVCMVTWRPQRRPAA